MGGQSFIFHHGGRFKSNIGMEFNRGQKRFARFVKIPSTPPAFK